MNEVNSEILRMTAKDIPAVMALAEECGLSVWSGAGYSAELENPDSVCFVVKNNQELIAFLVARLIRLEQSIEIYNIAVRKELRRKKIASRLLNYLKNYFVSDDLQKIFLEVRKSNQSAIKFYQVEGFKTIGQRKNFYQHPSGDAILMSFKE